MWLSRRNARGRSEHTTSDLLERVQRLEREHEELRARLEGEPQLRVLAAQIVGAAQVAPVIGEVMEQFALAMRAPSPRGRAGGLARARSAWRHFDGTFMPESARVEAYQLDYERYARGGRARAAAALRSPDETFARTA